MKLDKDQSRKLLSFESLIPLSTDLVTILISPFIFEFFIRSMKVEKINNIYWIAPLWLLLLLATFLDNRLKNEGNFNLSKFHGFVFMISAITFCLFLSAVSSGIMGVFNSMGEETGNSSGLFIFFAFLIFGFVYASFLLASMTPSNKQNIQAPQFKYYLTLVLVPLSTNLTSLFFTAFWAAKFTPSETDNTISIGAKLVFIPLLAITLIYLCGAPRLVLLYKRFNFISLASFIVFYLYQAWYFMNNH